MSRCKTAAPAGPPAASGGADGAPERAVAAWPGQIVPGLKPLVRAVFSVPKVLGVRNGALTLGAPNDAHRSKCEQYRPEVEAAIAAAVGARVPLSIITDGGGHDDVHGIHDDERHDPAPAARPDATVVPLHPAGPPPADDEIDLHDLVDAPPESVVSPIDRLAQAFPGSELIDERH